MDCQGIEEKCLHADIAIDRQFAQAPMGEAPAGRGEAVTRH
jgi:hypothetical protein